jgi:hypothetical protein
LAFELLAFWHPDAGLIWDLKKTTLGIRKRLGMKKVLWEFEIILSFEAEGDELLAEAFGGMLNTEYVVQAFAVRAKPRER